MLITQSRQNTKFAHRGSNRVKRVIQVKVLSAACITRFIHTLSSWSTHGRVTVTPVGDLVASKNRIPVPHEPVPALHARTLYPVETFPVTSDALHGATSAAKDRMCIIIRYTAV